MTPAGSTSEYCLTVETAGSGGYTDALKMVTPCSYSAAQQFKYDASGRLVHIATGKCLTYPSGADALVGTAITLATCLATAPYPHQIWRVDDKKALRPRHYLWAGLCLKVGTQAGAEAASCEYSPAVNTWTVGAQPVGGACIVIAVHPAAKRCARQRLGCLEFVMAATLPLRLHIIHAAGADIAPKYFTLYSATYALLPTARTWARAEAVCDILGIKLATIYSADHSNSINAEVRKYISSTALYWVGARRASLIERLAGATPWVWVDGLGNLGGDGKGPGWTGWNPWAPGQPDGFRGWGSGSDNCVAVGGGSNSALWGDAPCTTRYPYVCVLPGEQAHTPTNLLPSAAAWCFIS
jgi:hypothetical protein